MGWKRKDGYIYVKKDGKTMGEHRAIWMEHHGPIPPGAVIHHKNKVKDDNRIENLQMFRSSGEHRHECHVDLSCLDPERPRMKAFDLVDMMFIRSHLPLDRI